MDRSQAAKVEPGEVISRDPDVHSGDVVFAGTRVPVDTLIDYLKCGQSVDDFLEGFPTVERWQVEAFLDLSPGAADLAVVVLRPKSKALPHLLELMPELRRRLPNHQAGEVIRVHPPSSGRHGMTGG